MHQFYTTIFKQNDAVQLLTEPNSDYFSNYWLSTILIDPLKGNKMSREDLSAKLLDANIESRPLWKPMHLQPVFSSAPYYGGQVAENLFNKGLCLPSGSNLSEEEKDRIKRVLNFI